MVYFSFTRRKTSSKITLKKKTIQNATMYLLYLLVYDVASVEIHLILKLYFSMEIRIFHLPSNS